MVLQKRLEYGFNGYQAPAMPRASRSTRRRAKFQRAEDNQKCAFDLLATVAGKLLQEREDPTMSSNASSEKDRCGFVKDCQDANKPTKSELSDEGSCHEKSFSCPSQTNDKNCCLKEFPILAIDGHAGIASIVTSSSSVERFIAEKLVDGNRHFKMENVTGEVKLDSPDCSKDSHFQLDVDTSKGKDELHKFENVPNGSGIDMCSFEKPLDENPPALISIGGNAKLSGYNDRTPLSKGCDDVPVVSRDDDENSSGCIHPINTKPKSFRPKNCIGDNRISKRLASNFRKVAEKPKDGTRFNSDGDWKRTYYSKRNCNKRQSSQMNIPFKKRKLYYSSVSNTNAFIRSGGIYYSPENCMNKDACDSPPGMHKVKLRIKSFRVPELFIEVPETATIGSLKRTVMDAVTAVLGGELHVGVFLQGKKVRDDSKTLLQTGISHDNQMDALGFTLESNSSHSLPIVCAAHSPRPSADITQPVIRYPSSPAVIDQKIQGNSDMSPEHQVTSLASHFESDYDSAPSPINMSVDNGMKDSKELVTVLEMDKEELAMVPVLQKPKRSEVVQRRIRRPFSVEEVEALVQAVEKLGTGRWRDVKICAFDNAKHRTYVDLKDKWKTLVHTARISPQQRRGEPVPQELLDRVLVAHSYWSQQQTKQQHKQHPETETVFSFNNGQGHVDGGVMVSDFCY
ncbi:telomere repeat-binding protein 5 isoform X1 [Cajanus cajan]|uniref:telomere repeat-binding protein 5 isoform X1 n=1 Tax=Cajanus cajan TaxID=3821 RepID=UPI00098D8EA3|nr:telomere repeat-binding protein 5 isoform X1 [Cajanus cajan]XP_020214265.1 telomere repeat-binding protein 5 isoform X1 [Cajanus cajan]XP_020214266.1 telomere repeat-binding protein 5 isoform X1 [Cajanus cajan]